MLQANFAKPINASNALLTETHYGKLARIKDSSLVGVIAALYSSTYLPYSHKILHNACFLMAIISISISYNTP